MGKIITVASGKGGTGKTTTVAALSSCLAVLGHKTLCIDMDTGMGNLDLAMGMVDFTVMDYTDVICEKAGANDTGRPAADETAKMSVLQACSLSPYIPDLYFLSAPAGGEPAETDRAGIGKMFREIRENFDYCLIDSPPGIGTGFSLAHNDADMSIIVTTGDLPAMRDATRAAGTLRDMGIDNIRLLVNKIRPGNLRYIKTTIDDIIDTTGIRLIGLIPEDRSVFRALHDGTPLILYHKRKCVYDYLDTALRITGEEIPLRQRG